jgi:hypothetical protein
MIQFTDATDGRKACRKVRKQSYSTGDMTKTSDTTKTSETSETNEMSETNNYMIVTSKEAAVQSLGNKKKVTGTAQSSTTTASLSSTSNSSVQIEVNVDNIKRLINEGKNDIKVKVT